MKRPGRLGDLIIQIPDVTKAGAEAILAVYARERGLPFALDDTIRTDLDEATIRERFLRPAVSRTFDATVLRYSTETARREPVTLGGLLASVHFEHAMSSAKRRAAQRELYGDGVPAITVEDIFDGLLEQAVSAAKGVAADRSILNNQLCVTGRVTAVELVPAEEISNHHFVRTQS